MLSSAILLLWEIKCRSSDYVMPTMELDRNPAYNEPDKAIHKHLSEKTERTDRMSKNDHFRADPYEEVQILPFEIWTHGTTRESSATSKGRRWSSAFIGSSDDV